MISEYVLSLSRVKSHCREFMSELIHLHWRLSSYLDDITVVYLTGSFVTGEFVHFKTMTKH